MLGTIKRISDLKSSLFEVPSIDIWLPNNYDASNAYPVCYMQDGQALFDPALTWNNKTWEIDKSMTQLIASGKIEPCIIVGIWHHEKARNTDYLPQKPFDAFPEEFQSELTGGGELHVRSDEYLGFLVQELKPYIDANFATKQDRDHTFIAGASMGALISLYALCEYPLIFGRAACLSTHWTLLLNESNNPAPKVFEKYLQENLPPPESHKIYFDLGTGFFDNYYLPHQDAIDRVMLKKGFTNQNWITAIHKGHTHSEEFWAKRFPDAITFLMNGKL